MGVLDLKHTTEHEITLEWESGASNDMIADSTIALIAGIDKSPASVKSRVEPHTFSWVLLTPFISLIGQKVHPSPLLSLCIGS